MSTLPLLYSPHRDPPPARQGGIFALPTRTRASQSMYINPSSKPVPPSPELLQPADYTGVQLLGKSSLLVKRRYSMQKARSRSHHSQYDTTSVAPDTLTLGRTCRVDEVASLDSLLQAVQNNARLICSILSADSEDIKSIHTGLEGISTKIAHQLGTIGLEMAARIDKASKCLSACRRETGMQTKVSGQELISMMEQSRTTAAVMEQAQKSVQILLRECEA